MVELEWDQRTTVILVSGRAGVGKTTFANFVMKHLPSDLKKYSVKGAFATMVKLIANLMGWDGKKDDRGRNLLQHIGNVGREYNPDSWVETLINHLEQAFVTPLDFIIIDDWRFPNELKWFVERDKEYKVYTVRIFAPSRESLNGTPYYNDISETSLPVNPEVYDFPIDNEITLYELEEKAKEVLSNILMFV